MLWQACVLFLHFVRMFTGKVIFCFLKLYEPCYTILTGILSGICCVSHVISIIQALQKRYSIKDGVLRKIEGITFLREAYKNYNYNRLKRNEFGMSIKIQTFPHFIKAK